MRVIFVNRFFFPDHSATSQMLTDLVADLGRSHLDVTVITSRQRIDDARAGLPGRERVEGAEIHRVWSSTFGRGSLPGRALDYLTFYLAAGWRLMRLCARGDVVVAKTDPPLISVVAGWVVRLRGARQVNWLHDLFPEIAEMLGVRCVGGPTARLLARWRDRSLRLAAANVVLGERMAARVRARGIDEARIRIIHNWCDGELVRPLSRADHPLRREWGLEGRFVVGYSGNMGYAHDFDTVLDAVESLQRDDVRFLFVGDGVRRGWLEAEVARRRLENVLFRPYQPREGLNLSLTAADVHLVTLLPPLEGLIVPSKFYGIAAAGRPALFVGDPDGEVARLIAAHGCGMTVASGDSAALCSCIETLVADPDLCASLGAAARTAFEANFERARATGAWREVLVEALGGDAAGT